MGPKVESALRFLNDGGREVIITSYDQLAAAVHGTPAPIWSRVTNMTLAHVVESQQFTVPLLMELFARTRQMEKIVARGGTLDYQNRIMATLFYEPSTRTRLSFEAAMYRLGGRVMSTEQAGSFRRRSRASRSNANSVEKHQGNADQGQSDSSRCFGEF